ncbi:hypothetical protein RJT34_24518 [Clitoria ternatea]|uniref:Uncharacterized protein n=1 Tax=Clitoria ternatea TaxID=43366 RepID=A0AAN9FUA3_CLITE
MKKRKNAEIDSNDPLPSALAVPDKGDPKTSEYAFFKKLKKDASFRFRSHPLDNDSSVSSSMNHESSHYFREKTGDVRVASKTHNSSRIIQDVTTVRTDSFLSPFAGVARSKPGLHSITNPKNSQDYSDNFKSQHTSSHEGNQCGDGKIFSIKRQKLRQFAAGALFSDTEKLCSKGHIVVSMLLSRLFPMSIEENKYEDPNPGKVVNATRNGLPNSRESDHQFKEHYRIPNEKFPELESSPYFSDHALSPMFLRSYERITPYTEFPANLSHNFQPLCCITEPECKFSATPSFSAAAKSDVSLGSLFNKAANATRHGLLGSWELDVQFAEHYQIPKRKLLELESNSNLSDHLLSPMFLRSVEIITPPVDFPTFPHKLQPLLSRTETESKFGGSFIDKTDLTRGLLCNEQKHEILTLNHFKELGKLKREPIPLLLDKDFDYTTDDTKLPITFKHTKPVMLPELSMLGHGEEHILNNTLDEYHFSPSSSPLDKPQDFNSILDSGFFRYQEFKFEKYVSEDVDMNFSHTALSLSRNKHYFKLSENSMNDPTSRVQDRMYFSPYQHWVKRTVSNDYHLPPDLEAWVSSSQDECQNSLPLTGSHLNYQNSSSRTLQLPKMEKMSSPFHIGDKYNPETDGGNHGELLYHFREGMVEIYNNSFLRMSMQRDMDAQFFLDDNDYVNEQEQTQKLLL